MSGGAPIIRQCLALLYEVGEVGMTAQEAADRLGVRQNGVAIGLARLLNEGWLTVTKDKVPKGRRGPKPKRYRVMEE